MTIYRTLMSQYHISRDIYRQVTTARKLPKGRPPTVSLPRACYDRDPPPSFIFTAKAVSHFGRATGICSASYAALCEESGYSQRVISSRIGDLVYKKLVFRKLFRCWGDCEAYLIMKHQAPLAVQSLRRAGGFAEATEIMEFFDLCDLDIPGSGGILESYTKGSRKAIKKTIKEENSREIEPHSPSVCHTSGDTTPHIYKLSTIAKENSIYAHAREEAAAEPPAEDAAAFFNSEMERDLAKRLKPEEVKKAMDIHARLSVEELAKPKNMTGWLIVAVQQGWGDKYLERKSPEEAQENIQANEKTAKAMEYAVWSTRDERKNYSTMASAGNKTLEICSGGASCQTDFIEYSLPTSEFNLKLIEAAKKRRLLQCPAIASIVNQLPGSDPDATESVSMTPSQRSKDPFKKNSSLSYQPRPSNSSDPSESRSSSRCQYPHHTRNLSKAIFSEERMSKSQTSQTSLSLSKMLSTDSFGKTIHRLSPSMQEKYTGKKRELSYG